MAYLLDADVFSIEKVGDEIKAGDDKLAKWGKKRGEGFFLAPTPEVLEALGRVADWANGQDYQPTAIDTFLQVADYYLIAHGLACRYEVVTHEIPSSNVCIGLSVKCLTPYEMLRRERVRLVLGAAA